MSIEIFKKERISVRGVIIRFLYFEPPAEAESLSGPVQANGWHGAAID